MRFARPVVFAVLLLALACDRRVEPYVEGEQPRQPDLSRIFPAGPEQSPELQRPPSAPPPPPGRPAPGARAAGSAPSGPPIRGTVRFAQPAATI